MRKFFCAYDSLNNISDIHFIPQNLPKNATIDKIIDLNNFSSDFLQFITTSLLLKDLSNSTLEEITNLLNAKMGNVPKNNVHKECEDLSNFTWYDLKKLNYTDEIPGYTFFYTQTTRKLVETLYKDEIELFHFKFPF